MALRTTDGLELAHVGRMLLVPKKGQNSKPPDSDKVNFPTEIFVAVFGLVRHEDGLELCKQAVALLVGAWTAEVKTPSARGYSFWRQRFFRFFFTMFGGFGAPKNFDYVLMFCKICKSHCDERRGIKFYAFDSTVPTY